MFCRVSRAALIGLAIVVTIVAALSAVHGRNAEARESLAFPFDSGQTWTVTRGYNCSPSCSSHVPGGSDGLALDLVRSGGGSDGENVRAVFQGTVTRVGLAPNGWGCRIVLTGNDGAQFLYVHVEFNPSPGQCNAYENNPVQGQVVGKVWNGLLSNGQASGIGPHLHVQWCWNAWAGCTNPNAVALNEGAFCFPTPGPFTAGWGEWHNQTFSETTCGTPPTPTFIPTPTPTPRGQSCTSDLAPPERIGQRRSDGVFYVKEGALTQPWLEQSNGVVAICLSGDRIGEVRSDGLFYVKEGALTEPFVQQSDSVVAIAMAGDRIGEVRSDGLFYVKEGALTEPFEQQSDSVVAIAMTGVQSPSTPTPIATATSSLGMSLGGVDQSPDADALSSPISSRAQATEHAVAAGVAVLALVAVGGWWKWHRRRTG